VVGEDADPESGEQAKGTVEGGDDGAGYKAAEAGMGDRELRNEPLGRGSDEACSVAARARTSWVVRQSRKK